eukprot:3157274-Prymnesium_polylepis.2
MWLRRTSGRISILRPPKRKSFRETRNNMSRVRHALGGPAHPAGLGAPLWRAPRRRRPCVGVGRSGGAP